VDVAGDELPKYGGGVLPETVKPQPAKPGDDRTNPGLANVFWGAGVWHAPPMSPAQRRRAAKLIALILATTVLPALIAGLVVGFVSGAWGWAAGAAAAVYLVATIVAMVVSYRYDRKRGIGAT
jgi:hypothetical protein